MPECTWTRNHNRLIHPCCAVALQVTCRMFHPDLCLFKPLENGHYLLDSRSGANQFHLQYFNFLGLILGKAIRDRQIVDARLAISVFSELVGKRRSFDTLLEELKEVDPGMHKSLSWMLANDIEGIIFENFTVLEEGFGEKKEVELIAGGQKMEVTDQNKLQYAELLIRWILGTSFSAQLGSLVQGFHALVPKDLLQVRTTCDTLGAQELTT